MKQDSSYHFARLYHIVGVFVVAFLSAPLHFIYEWFGENPIIGSFTPVNESVWEHLKLPLWPMLLWWVVGFFIFRNRKQLKTYSWFFSCFISILLTPFIIISFFYIFEAGFGIESLFLDIMTLYLAIFIGQIVALHSYHFSFKSKIFWFILTAFLTITFTLSTIWFTFYPPNFPIFISAQ